MSPRTWTCGRVNVQILKAAKTTLAFYPDRVLAFQGSAVGGVSYQRLQAVSAGTRFIEHETVPSNARVVDRTWQYVNKRGGPDKRFNNNRELPVCAYNQFNLSAPDGLDVGFLGSREGGFDAPAVAIEQIRRASWPSAMRCRRRETYSTRRRAYGPREDGDWFQPSTAFSGFFRLFPARTDGCELRVCPSCRLR